MPRQTLPTLEDVAQMAGVSTATVSRCLNTPDRVVQRTREKVMKAVNELGYSPNFGARALAAKKTYTIGAVIPTMENAIFARGLQAFQEELHRLGYVLLVASSSYDPQAEEDQIRSLVSRGADGLLLIGHDRAPDILEFLRVQNVPTIVAWAHDESSDLSSIGFDNRIAMRNLAAEIIRLGHRRIAMISAPTEANDRARMRVLGVKDALSENGIAGEYLALVEVPYGIETGQQAFITLMEGAQPPSVVMCGNDVLAAGALTQARKMGLRGPEDISITGFDDIELAEVVEPALTTVHVPHREMGHRAAEALVMMLNSGAVAGRVELHTDIRMRGTLAAPANQSS